VQAFCFLSAMLESHAHTCCGRRKGGPLPSMEMVAMYLSPV
jgi:hypothetical protein